MRSMGTNPEAGAWFIPHVSNMDSTEILGLRNGVFMSAHMGFSKVVVEMDCGGCRSD